LSETLAEPDPAEAVALELDELWSFVLKRANKRWIWVALCRATRQVVAYAVGDRSHVTCQKLWAAIPEAYRRGHCFSDFREAYRLVIPSERHTAAGKESGLTAHVERWNNTLAPKARALRQEESVVLEIRHDARAVSAPLSARLQQVTGSRLCLSHYRLRHPNVYHRL
jgi:IS1 family transposase